MGKGNEKEGVLVKPVTQLKTNFKECMTVFENWVTKQSKPVKAALSVAIVTANSAISAAAFVFLVKKVCSRFSISLDEPLVIDNSKLIKAYLGLCKTYEVRSMTMSRQGFGAGFIFSLVCGSKGTNAITDGLCFALLSILRFKEEEKRLQQKTEDKLYKNTRGMLAGPDLDRYEKNFKRGSFTDRALPLLTDSDLQEVNIPAGARRLILDHIQREKKVKNQERGSDEDIVGRGDFYECKN